MPRATGVVLIKTEYTGNWCVFFFYQVRAGLMEEEHLSGSYYSTGPGDRNHVF